MGFGHLSRETVLKDYTPDLSKKLFPNVVIAVDGTYVYCQKSRHYKTQFETYSTYKHRNLVKFMVWSTMNGHVMMADDPFYGNDAHNDDKIVEFEIGKYLISTKVSEIMCFYFIRRRPWRHIYMA